MANIAKKHISKNIKDMLVYLLWNENKEKIETSKTILGISSVDIKKMYLENTSNIVYTVSDGLAKFIKEHNIQASEDYFYRKKNIGVWKNGWRRIEKIV